MKARTCMWRFDALLLGRVLRVALLMAFFVLVGAMGALATEPDTTDVSPDNGAQNVTRYTDEIEVDFNVEMDTETIIADSTFIVEGTSSGRRCDDYSPTLKTAASIA